jgi:hypothetical protein
MSGQDCGVFKAMMLLSPPPHGHCKQWGQTGNQTLRKENQRSGLTLRSSEKGSRGNRNVEGRMFSMPPSVFSVILRAPHPRQGNSTWGRAPMPEDLGGEGCIGC